MTCEVETIAFVRCQNSIPLIVKAYISVYTHVLGNNTGFLFGISGFETLDPRYGVKRGNSHVFHSSSEQHPESGKGLHNRFYPRVIEKQLKKNTSSFVFFA